MWSAEHSLSLIKEGPFVYYKLQRAYVGVDSGRDVNVHCLSSRLCMAPIVFMQGLLWNACEGTPMRHITTDVTIQVFRC